MIRKVLPLLALSAMVAANYVPESVGGRMLQDHDRDDRDRDERDREDRDREDQRDREEQDRREQEDREREEQERREQEERDREPDCERHPEDERCSPFYMQPSGTPSPQPTFLYEHNINDFGEAKLFSPDSVKEDYYGFAVSVWESTVVVGAYATVAFGSSNSDITGSVFIYNNHDVYNTRLVVAGSDETFFGYATAVWENTVVVGAPREDFRNCDDCGAAYVYTRYNNGSWILDDTLIAEDYIDYHYVGFDVAIYQDIVIVGAPGDKGHMGYANTGAAYIFHKDGSTGLWTYDQKLTISSDNDDKHHGKEYDHFGSAVAIYGEYAVVGSYGSDRNTGTVFVYYHLGFWSAKYKLLANDEKEGAFFGYSVAIYQDVIVVGAYNGDGHWYGAGSAYVFELVGGGAGFVQTSKLVAHDGMSGDFFGFSVAVFQNVAIIGAHGEEGKGRDDKEGPRFRNKQQRKLPGEGHQKEDGENCGPNSPPDCKQFEGMYSYRGTGAGAAYVFKRSGTSWGQVMKLVPSYSEAYDHFGVSVATYNEEFIVGADTADGVVDDTGAVYVFYPTFSTDYDNERTVPPVQDVVDSADQETGIFSGTSTSTAAFAFIVVLAPVAMGLAYWFVQSNRNSDGRSKDGLMQLPQDSRHGATVPWSMHGAFDESSWGLESSHSAAAPAAPGTRSPLRAQASVAK